MEHRIRTPRSTDQPATIRCRIGLTVTGELPNIRYDEAFLVNRHACGDSPLRRHPRLRGSGTAMPAAVPGNRAKANGSGLAFRGYDGSVSQYLDHRYSKRQGRLLRPALFVAEHS